jgi:hypothetical protein
MKAIEVLVNGKRLCVAGSGPGELTFVSFTLDEREEPLTTVLVAGSRTTMVPRWIDDYRIEDGDEVVLRIVDVAEADPPFDSTPAWTEFPQIKIERPS